MTEVHIPIGYTKKAHGAKGEIKVEIQDNFLKDFLNAEVVFIALDGKPVPFFIENIRDCTGLLLKLEEINSPTDAKKITSREIFLRQSDIHYAWDEDDSLSYSFCKGYELFDEQAGRIGKVDDVLTFPQQELANVKTGKRDLLIPLHPDLIVKLDNKKKVIIMRLPEGLLDI